MARSVNPTQASKRLIAEWKEKAIQSSAVLLTI
jgi:hypothetical protein